jgi:hypothetical protein
MDDGGDGGAGPPGGGAASDEHSGGRRRDPDRDVLDPRGPMGMPKIVSRAANRLGHGPQGGANIVAGIYALSVLAIIIGLGIFFIVGGH